MPSHWGFADYFIPRNWRSGGLLLLGRDPGDEEIQQGKPFVGRAGKVLNDHLRQAGIRRESCAILNVSRYRPPGNNFSAHSDALLESELRHLCETLDRLKPGVIVALGNEASWVVVKEWPDSRSGEFLTHSGNIKGATDIQNRRGYIWESPHASTGVLTTIHPAAVDREWVPWSPLLTKDLTKAKELHHDGRIRRPQREVEIVGSHRDARRAAQGLRRYGWLASDIENYDERRLTCVGFAGEAGRAVVFPAPFFDECRSLLEDPEVKTVWQNGAYDLYFLATRNDLRVKNYAGDAMLQWHSMIPELAGAIEGEGRRRTRKSLTFLASLYTQDTYWKSYDFADDEERFILNGRDCATTWEIHEIQQEQVDLLGVRETYEHELALVWPVVDMEIRGLKVDESLRAERQAAIEERQHSWQEQLNEVVLPLLEERWDSVPQQHLFERISSVCECCGHGSRKQQACWSCAGFKKAPSKVELVEAGGDASKKKAELEAEMLPVCAVCKGEPRRERLEYNPNSDTQTKVLLYDILKLPKRYSNGKLTTNEGALKGLLGRLS